MAVLTSPGPTASQHQAGIPRDYIFRLSVDQYHDMIRAGILTTDDPVELLDGWLVVKMSKNPRHTLATQKTRVSLEQVVVSGWFVNAQEPITTDTSEPEPDISVIRGKLENYRDRHPAPQEIGMLVEVSDSSLDRDQGWKKEVYARAKIPVYWIINLPENRLEVYTDPTGPAAKPDYGPPKIFGPSDEVPVVLDGQTIARIPVKSLLP